MNALKDLQQLRPYFADRAHLQGPIANKFTSPSYLAALDHAAADPDQLARLTIALLQHIALDPRLGSKVEDFLDVGPSRKYAGPAYVMLRLYCISNFVGFFSLPVDSPEMPNLLKAIADNLASRKFKAAQVHARMQDLSSMRYSRICEKGLAAYKASYAEAEVGAPAWKAYDNDERMAYYRTHVFPKAEHAQAVIIDSRTALLKKRMRNLSDQTCDAGFLGGYTDICTEFALRYLVPDAAVLQ